MQQTAATTQVISKSYMSGLFLKCGLFFTAGLLLTGIILYFSAHQPLGPTYQESFSRLAQLKEEMLMKSIITYCLITALILAGVVFITVIYSHRVVGPLVGIKRVVKAVTAGDLTQAVHIRKKDAIQPMATALNTLIDSYRLKIQLIDQQVKSLQDSLNRPGDQPQPSEIAAQAKKISDTLTSLHLQ
ncbi:MAG: methyl-accepting chemotaxis protein [Desulfobulbaceae bacterium]|nr:methyl-accepting chemotaxis protein [Desulfobulbaceae bacterium]